MPIRPLVSLIDLWSQSQVAADRLESLRENQITGETAVMQSEARDRAASNAGTGETQETDDKSRKRLQNRLAQKKYRERLKTRIEDLERRAATVNDSTQSFYSPTPIRSQPSSLHVVSRHGSTRSLEFDDHRQFSSPATLVEGQGREPVLNDQLNGPSRQCDPLLGQGTDLNDHLRLSMSDLAAGLPIAEASGHTYSVIGVGSKSDLESGQLWMDEVDMFSSRDPAAAANTCSNWTPQRADTDKKSRLSEGANFVAASRFLGGHKSSSEVIDPRPMDVQSVMAPSDRLGFARMNGESYQTQSRETRLGSVLNAAKLQGYENLDAVFSAYYTESFEVGTPIQIAQKMSRNRNLPSVLQNLRESVREWNPREANGYRDEIVRSAESVLVDEFDRAISKTEATTSGPKETGQSASLMLPHSLPTRITDESFETLSNLEPNLEDELPNLWALIISLTADNSEAGQRIRCQILLKVILTIAKDKSLSPLMTLR